MELVTSVTAFLSTRRPPCGPMSFTPMAASSRTDKGVLYLSVKTISFWLFFRLTFPWAYPIVSDGEYLYIGLYEGIVVFPVYKIRTVPQISQKLTNLFSLQLY